MKKCFFRVSGFASAEEGHATDQAGTPTRTSELAGSRERKQWDGSADIGKTDRDTRATAILNHAEPEKSVRRGRGKTNCRHVHRNVPRENLAAGQLGAIQRDFIRGAIILRIKATARVHDINVPICRKVDPVKPAVFT